MSKFFKSILLATALCGMAMSSGCGSPAKVQAPLPDISADYGEILPFLDIKEDSAYYNAAIDYFCYLTESYPVHAKLISIEPGNGHIETRTWIGDGYTMRAVWDEDAGGQKCSFEWRWDDPDAEKYVLASYEKAEEAYSEKGIKGKELPNDYAEENLAYASFAVKGSLYEVTKSNLQTGVEIDFSGERLHKLISVLKELRFDPGGKVVDSDNVRFHILLYTEEDEHALDIMMDGHWNACCDGMPIEYSEDLIIWVGELCEKFWNQRAKLAGNP